ncbi:MAG: flagellar motor protein MotA [Alphaproteobacteria bacterium]|mgnify:CR=1 FL=1|nr:flagellar motor protein MotA [Alphaproteobacteria bacterium]
MTNPRIYLTRMAIFLALAVVIAGVLSGPLLEAFMANPAINGVIGVVLTLGLLYVFRQVWMLEVEVRWIESYRSHRPGMTVEDPPHLLAPMAAMIGDRQGQLRLNTTSMRSILDGISARLDESRDISRYTIGLLIFLGLLGTFWGLLQTVSSVAGVIAGLQVGGGDTLQVFNNLKSGLEAPLSGMGTAFSSSLFGLAGSLLLGFLELQASAAQNRFYNDLEDWLSTATRVSVGGLIGGGEGDHSVPAYIQALLETTADSLDKLQRTVAQAEASRSQGDQSLTTLADRLTTLTDQMRTEQELMVRLAENQAELKPVLQRLAEPRQSDGFDDATRGHIRNIDTYLARMVEDQVSGRNQIVQELRSEIRLLARTIAALAEDDGR